MHSQQHVTPKIILYNDMTQQFFSVTGSNVHIWDATDGRKVHTFWDIFDNGDFISAMRFEGRKRKLIAGSESGQIIVLNSVSGAEMKTCKPHAGHEVSHLEYCDEFRFIISGVHGGAHLYH